VKVLAFERKEKFENELKRRADEETKTKDGTKRDDVKRYL
jgi:hypothetical protein